MYEHVRSSVWYEVDLMSIAGCPWPARRWFRLLWCLIALGILAALPALIYQFQASETPVNYQVCLLCYSPCWQSKNGFEDDASWKPLGGREVGLPWLWALPLVSARPSAHEIAISEQYFAKLKYSDSDGMCLKAFVLAGLADSWYICCPGCASHSIWGGHALRVFFQAPITDLRHSYSVDGPNLCSRCLACFEVQGEDHQPTSLIIACLLPPSHHGDCSLSLQALSAERQIVSLEVWLRSWAQKVRFVGILDELVPLSYKARKLCSISSQLSS